MEEYKLLKKYQKEEKEVPYKKVILSFFSKVLISVILFLMVLIASKNTEYKNLIYEYVYSSNISFLEVEKWYKKYFGNLIPSDNKVEKEPVSSTGISYKSLEEIENGVELYLDKGSIVPALESGLVIFKGEKDGYSDLIVLEQVDGSEAWYVGVVDSNLKIYDYVEKDSIIGNSKTEYLSLYFKKKGETIDYKKYLF